MPIKPSRCCPSCWRPVAAKRLRGKEHVEYDNPYDVGMTGLIGFASGYLAMKNCDTLLMLGTNFPYRQFYPEHGHIAQIDLRPEALGNRCWLELGLLGDVKLTLQAVLPKLAQNPDRDHLESALKDYKKARQDLDALAESGPNSDIIHPRRALAQAQPGRAQVTRRTDAKKPPCVTP